MRIIDGLLMAPTLFCIGGIAIAAFTDAGQSRLWIAVAAASLASLVLYAVLQRARTRGTRLRPTPLAEPCKRATSPRGRP